MLISLILNKAEFERILTVATPERCRVDVERDAWTRAVSLHLHVFNEATEDEVFNALDKYANDALKRAFSTWLQVDINTLVKRAQRPANRLMTYEVDVTQKNVRAACKAEETPAYIMLEDYGAHERAPVEVFISTVIAAVAERDIQEGRVCTKD